MGVERQPGNGAGGGDASQLLPRLVGYGQTMRLLLSGDNIDAQEAWHIGLVEYLVADNEVNDTALSLCQRLAEHHPLALQAVKSAVLVIHAAGSRDAI